VRPPVSRRRARLLQQAARRQQAEAEAAWENLPLEHRRRCAAELVLTRARELQLAYPDIIAIGHGFRTRGRERTRGLRKTVAPPGRVTDEPCVVLTVGRKWRRGIVARRGREIPAFLWSYVEHEGRPVLCAVPTDVRCGTELKVTPRLWVDDNGGGGNGQSGLELIRVTDGVHTPQKGTFCCAVQRPDSGEIFGLSCHHVLAMSTKTHPPGTPSPGQVTLRSTGARIGEIDFAWLGRLVRPGIDLSFDAALCQVDAGARGPFRQACGAVRPTSVLPPGPCPVDCTVMTAQNGRLRARLVMELSFFNGVGYFPSGDQPIQPRIAEFDIVGGITTAGGDSGCAVLDSSGTMLVGMHIGGRDGTNRIFVIPAYDLVDGLNWGREGALSVLSAF